MIDLFDSNKSRLKEDSANALPDFIANLKKTSATDITSLLDGAKRVKLASIMANESSKDVDIDDNQTQKIYHDPLIFSEDMILEQLTDMRNKVEVFESKGQMEEVAMIAVWYLSLSSLLFKEQLESGQELWNELSRGFDDCMFFDPEKDIVKGLEPYKKS